MDQLIQIKEATLGHVNVLSILSTIDPKNVDFFLNEIVFLLSCDWSLSTNPTILLVGMKPLASLHSGSNTD